MNSIDEARRQALAAREQKRRELLAMIEAGVDADVPKFHTLGAYAYAMRLDGYDWHVVGVNAYTADKRKPHESQHEFAKRCSKNASAVAHAFAKRYSLPWPIALVCS